MYGSCMVHNTTHLILCQCCDAIFDEYSNDITHCRRTSDQWKAVAAEFSSRWNFHHTLGAIDGNHVANRCPKNGGSLYLSYKVFHWIILFVFVDANYKFMWVDMGANGLGADAQIFDESQLRADSIDRSPRS